MRDAIEYARKLKQEAQAGGNGGNGGNVVTMRAGESASSGGKWRTDQDKAFKSAKSASSGGLHKPVNTGLPAKSAKSATRQAQSEYVSPMSKLRAELLPCEVLGDDLEYLLKYLPITTDERNGTIQGYRYEWQLGMAAEPVEHKKQNAGRFRANTWLRKQSAVKTGL
jgi:hypothetical protein